MFCGERFYRQQWLYKAATSVTPWLPVFFLYFIEKVSLGDAVLLGSVYYFFVFILEVPSGYLSDRLGRRFTLILAASITLFACVCFMLANSFEVLAFGQFLFAARAALQSGSDSALLYDSLLSLERQQEYSRRESEAQKWSMLSMACSCLVGGFLGGMDLRLPYTVGFCAALVAIYHSVCFLEPPVADESQVSGFFRQLKDCIGFFAHPLLAWVLTFFIIGFSLEHIPYEFYQPYLKLLEQDAIAGWLANSSAPLVSGVVIGISMFGGAIGAAMSERLLARVGLLATLLSSVSVQVIIVAGLSIVLHPIMLLLVMFRNFSMSMAHGPMLGAVSPHVPSAQRATFLSLLSLAGRASFSVVLAMLSILVVGKETLNWVSLSQILAVSAVLGVVALVLLFLGSRVVDFGHRGSDG